MLTNPEVYSSPEAVTVPQSLLGESQATLRQVEGLLGDFSLASESGALFSARRQKKAFEALLADGHDEVLGVARLLRRSRLMLTDLGEHGPQSSDAVGEVHRTLTQAEGRLGDLVRVLALLGRSLDEGSELSR